ncbi:Adenine specific DNA methylase [Nitrospira sp. ND1]|jgi:adenine-specific DNA-methyltransferase|uniref:site-specific DNA-methyltransferase n=1 Tax=Nitrospira sp. ND1 TaxID=1658518 RepID=UPI0009B9A551|nr:site-specific DNA-methyltransferase [Nitrospira sp. ND1]SLM43909.1 Adenine specific DNA methylase [Nitrospira sp. ND1]
MPTLNWIGKEAVVNHHQQVPFHLLKDVPDLACGEPGEGNLIVQGDNLVALKALLPYYAGQVKCIYIDPPYNTGNENWVYNDNVNSPLMREWLGKVVGKEGETLDRHDRWLCMMYPRLALLRQFLREDGAIFISLDDNEIHALRYAMDEIFGPDNFITTVLWQKVYSPKNSARHFSEDHDYIVVYAKKAEVWRPNLVPRSEEQDSAYINRDNDPRGAWKTSDLSGRNPYSEGLYSVTCPSGRIIAGPPKGRYWTISKEKFAAFDSEKRIWWGRKGDSIPQLKRFLSEVKQGVVPQTMWFYGDVGHTQDAKKELLQLVEFSDSESVFVTPKPTRLIERIVQIATSPGDLVLDSFAGSGTTGHAVLKLNQAMVDQAPRRFILVEIEAKIARQVTAERVRRAASGYANTNGGKVEGLGGGFRYCELGESLFDESGKIRETVSFADLARHVYFTETGEPLPRGRVTKSPLLGECRGVGVYLLYNGILNDKTANGGNVLTRSVLAQLPTYDGQKVIYCAGCLLGKDRLQAERILVRQTPYEIKVS